MHVHVCRQPVLHHACMCIMCGVSRDGEFVSVLSPPS